MNISKSAPTSGSGGGGEAGPWGGTSVTTIPFCEARAAWWGLRVRVASEDQLETDFQMGGGGVGWGQRVRAGEATSPADRGATGGVPAREQKGEKQTRSPQGAGCTGTQSTDSSAQRWRCGHWCVRSLQKCLLLGNREVGKTRSGPQEPHCRENCKIPKKEANEETGCENSGSKGAASDRK